MHVISAFILLCLAAIYKFMDRDDKVMIMWVILIVLGFLGFKLVTRT